MEATSDKNLIGSGVVLSETFTPVGIFAILQCFLRYHPMHTAQYCQLSFSYSHIEVVNGMGDGSPTPLATIRTSLRFVARVLQNVRILLSSNCTGEILIVLERCKVSVAGP